MNRFRKEERIKQQASLDNLSPLEIKWVEKDEAVQFELARQIHIKTFPEEYDFTLDDHVDHAQRKKGINPMSEEYISSVAHKRAEAGVSPLSENGMPVSDDSWEIAYAEAEALVRG